jgi:tripartite ATP-independent transporter DctM subunit
VIAVLLTTMLVLFALSVPIAVSLGVSGIIGVATTTDTPLLVILQQVFATLDRYPLAAIPFYILAGNLMGSGGISRRLVDLAVALVGRSHGGLACACIITCMLFAAVSGSSVATTFAIGSILIPAMLNNNYPRPFACSLQAAAAELGVIIPPSIPMMLYGIAAEVSIADLFIAGFGPGILIGLALMGYVYLHCRSRGYGAPERVTRPPIFPVMRRATFALLMPVIVLGGIYGGVFTPTEASVVAVFYALFVGVVLHRELRLAAIYEMLRTSTLTSAAIMLIIATAGTLSVLLTRAGAPEQIGQWLVATFATATTFLLAVNAFLFVLGMFVETGSAILILGPILAPVAAKFGIDPVHFGIILVVNMALGMITPPFGVNLFAVCAIARTSIDEMFFSLLPFVAVVAGCLLVITFVPELSLALGMLLKQ